MNEQQTEVAQRTAPLWQTTLKAIRDAGLHFGARFEISWLENQLNCQRDSIAFGVGISQINDDVIPEGYYLSSRNQAGQCYTVITPENAECVADAYGRGAFRALRRQAQLCGGLLKNPTANLAADQRRRLESKQEKAAFRLVMLRRSESIRRIITEHSPKLLE